MKTKKLISGSFWLVMAVHLIVCSAIGLCTAKGWRLLIIFLSGLSVSGIFCFLLRRYSRRHPEKRRLATFLSNIFR